MCQNEELVSVICQFVDALSLIIYLKYAVQV